MKNEIDIKKQLYNAIMEKVAIQVKNAILENAPFVDGKYKYIICTPAEREAVIDYIDSIFDDKYYNDIHDNHTIEVEFDECEDEITLANMTGTLSGYTTYDVDGYYYNDGDGYQRWVGFEIEDTSMNTDHYDIDFHVYDENGDYEEYTVYLTAADYKKAHPHENDTIENTEVHQRYLDKRAAEREEAEKERQRQYELDRQKAEKAKQDFIDMVQADPEKYRKIADAYMEEAKKDDWDWENPSEAEKYYEALGMKEEARIAHAMARSAYHREEAAAGLL